MEVVAYNAAAAVGTPAKAVTLGAVAQQIWVNGFRRSQRRAIQVSRPINAPAPNLYDRLTKMEDFSFAAGQSFADVGSSLIQLGTFPDTVPTLAHLSFTQGNQVVWLGNCGIEDVSLVEKKGALVIFSFKIIGGTWSKAKPF